MGFSKWIGSVVRWLDEQSAATHTSKLLPNKPYSDDGLEQKGDAKKCGELNQNMNVINSMSNDSH